MKSTVFVPLVIALAVLPAAAAKQAAIRPGGCTPPSRIAIGGPIGPITGQGKVEIAPDIARLTLSFTDERLVSPQAKLSAGIRRDNLISLRTAHAERMGAILAAVKAVVSPVTSIQARDVQSYPSDQELSPWDEKVKRQIFKGHSITTTVKIALRGTADSIKERLGRLFDSSAIQPDPSQFRPVYELSDDTRQQAERDAVAKSVQDARNLAEGFVETGERVGRILKRGESVEEVPSPRPAMALRSLSSQESVDAADDEGLGQRLFNLGTVTVRRAYQFVFEVVPGGFTPFPPMPPIARPLSGESREGEAPKKVGDV